VKELGEVGVKTVDKDKIEVGVQKVEHLDTDTARLWFRFPNGKSIVEEFEKPIPWDIYEYKLARIVDYSNQRPATFNRFLDSDGPEVLIKETQMTVEDSTLDELREASPGELYIEDQVSGDKTIYQVDTWETVDPKELVDDDRYDPEQKDDNKDGEEDFDPVYDVEHYTLAFTVTFVVLFLILDASGIF